MKKKVLGIELGSTRIKAVLIDEDGYVLASGSCDWENKLVNGYWSYSLDDVWAGVSLSYKNLKQQYVKSFGEALSEVSSIGISAMMHGYLAFDKQDNLLVPFRTWRNTNTQKAADQLTAALNFNIPIRWSVSHYYQAVLDKEPHISNIEFLTTLSGYVHYMLTGKKVIGVGDASGMFPVTNGNYNKTKTETFNNLLKANGINKDFCTLLPKVLLAGESGGNLTKSGALLLDPSGELAYGCIVCPPEGDAGTGMVATNSVAQRTANVSAGTSAFVMAVLDKPLSKVYPQIDVVSTPSGKDVAMVHVNNFSSEINEWADVFAEVVAISGGNITKSQLLTKLFNISAQSDGESDKLIGYNFLSGEPIADVLKGSLLIARSPSGNLNLANFMQMQIYSALGSVKIGMEILEQENVKIDCVQGHGGFFKTEKIGQVAMSAALNAPVSIMSNAGEGGAWGIALLALFASNNIQTQNKTTLDAFLTKIFSDCAKTVIMADKAENEKFARFMVKYKNGLDAQRKISEVLN